MSVNERGVRERHILSVAAGAAKACAGLDHGLFVASRLHHWALAYALQGIGAASDAMPEADRNAIPGVAWADIIAFGNSIKHGYFMIDPDRLWTIATRDIPELIARFKAAGLELASDDE
jgi:uncharacterized protein with HEPN domain